MLMLYLAHMTWRDTSKHFVFLHVIEGMKFSSLSFHLIKIWTLILGPVYIFQILYVQVTLGDYVGMKMITGSSFTNILLLFMLYSFNQQEHFLLSLYGVVFDTLEWRELFITHVIDKLWFTCSCREQCREQWGLRFILLHNMSGAYGQNIGSTFWFYRYPGKVYQLNGSWAL